MFSKAKFMIVASVMLMNGNVFFAPAQRVAAQAACDQVATDGLDHVGHCGEQDKANDGQNTNVDDKDKADVNDGEQGQNSNVDVSDGEQGQNSKADVNDGEQGQNGDQGQSATQTASQGSQGNSQ